jgi:homoserine dehydrogenase
MNKINIAVLGFGNVGSGTIKILNMNKVKIEAKTGCEINVKNIFVKDINKEREVAVSKDILTSNIDLILEDPSISIIVELLGGVEPALSYIKRALICGKNVVTANKQVIATYGNELRKLAKENNVLLKYEASVAGGIPILGLLSESLSGNEFNEITGIINGTTNFILTKMTEKGMDYDIALKDAQALGFAEADPSSDVLGEDVAYKLSILAKVGFNFDISPKDIPTEGINKISKDDIEYALEFGYKIKLLATIIKTGNQIECHVRPTFIPISHPLASVSNEYNALLIKGNAVSDIMVYGKGAGSMATGSAVVGDIIDIIIKGDCKKLFDVSKQTNDTKTINSYNSSNASPSILNFIGEGESMFYMNMIVSDSPGVMGKISTCLGNHEISIDSVIQRSSAIRNDGFVSVVYIVHKCSRTSIQDALKEIANYDFVKEIKSIIPVSPLN